ncbi:MAG: 2-dehydropantoate 2-reductase [Bacillus sp. (in: Bacteria)]|nr:2-dehydropantoate 2-reductase [Bacillus sp. (in: firmicutes)]
MKIGIVGSGALGLLFATYLSELHEVFLFTKRKEQADIINEKGIERIFQNKKKYVEVLAFPINKMIRQGLDLLIVTVKQYHLTEMIEYFQTHAHIPTLFVQNGMKHLELLKQLPHPQLYIGTVEHGALRLSDNAVRHTGIGKLNVAVFRGDRNILEKLCERPIPNFPVIIVENGTEMLLKKLAVNALINPLTAVLQVRNGQLISNKHYFHLMNQLLNEFVAVFPNFHLLTLLEHIVHICQTTSANRSSMLQDLERGRKTEIDGIVGYILDEAKKKEIQVPLFETLYWMIKGKEEES